MKACKDLEYLDKYHKELSNVSFRIKKELPKVNNEIVSKIISIKPLMMVINYSDLGNWSVEDILTRCRGESKTLVALADKISYMIHKGRSIDIKPMLTKIATGRIKKLSKPSIGLNAIFLGHGHFRWNHTAYTLNELELWKLNEFIKENY